MGKAETIQVFARIRPPRKKRSSGKREKTARKVVDYAVDGEEFHIRSSKIIGDETLNNFKEHHRFKLTGIYDTETTNETHNFAYKSR